MLTEMLLAENRSSAERIREDGLGSHVGLAVCCRRDADMADESAAQRVRIRETALHGDLFGRLATALQHAPRGRHPGGFHPGGGGDADLTSEQAREMARTKA